MSGPRKSTVSYTPSGGTLQQGTFLHCASSKGLPGSDLVEGCDNDQYLKVIVRKKFRYTTSRGSGIADTRIKQAKVRLKGKVLTAA